MTTTKEFALAITGLITGMALLLLLIYAIHKSNLLAPQPETEVLQAQQGVEQLRLD